MDQSPEKNYSIYVVFACTPTGVGRFIRFMTRHKYNHVCVALSKNLSSMYSFARYFKNAPLIGGFVEESSLRYNHNTPVKICEISLTEQEYFAVRECINEMQNSSHLYLYNVLSFALFPLRRKVIVDKAFTCIEFAIYVLSHTNLGLNPKKFYSIYNLEQLLDKYKIFEGNLVDIADFSGWGNDKYLCKRGKLDICTTSLKRLGWLIYRKLT